MLQLGALREALLEAGASPTKANEAAEELAGYESRFANVEKSLSTLKWMTGTHITITLIILGAVVKLLSH